MERPVEAVDLAAQGRRRVRAGQRLARELVQMTKMLREKSAAPRRDRAAKSDRLRDIRLAQATSIRIAERVGEVGDGLVDDSFKEHAIVAQLLVDSRGARLREI